MSSQHSPPGHMPTHQKKPTSPTRPSAHLLQRRSLLWLLLITFIFFTTTYVRKFKYQWRPYQQIAAPLHDTLRLEDIESAGDPNQTCSLPRVHPFDPSILPYLSEPRPIVCKDRQGLLTYIDDSGWLRLNASAFTENGYGHPESTSLTCRFSSILRPDGDDFAVTHSQARPLTAKGVKLDKDFVQVSCSNFAGFNVYDNIHANVRPVINVRSASESSQLVPDGKIDNLEDRRFSLLFLGIDSISRLAFIRHLPKTYRYLTESLGGHVFRGMTKVGDNTFPNLAALLTGKKVGTEIPEDGDFERDWKIIWKDFKDAGYATMFAEDQPHISLFNYLRQGLRDQPTDHYLRPFWLAVEKSAVHRLSSSLCFGATPKHLLQLRYARDFLYQYQTRSVPSFGLSFFVELSHDYLCKVGVADDDFANWLEDLYTSSLLNRTVLVLFSDHGHRFDAIRQTLVGRLEERLPFFAMYVPPALARQQPQIIQQLKTNSGRLTSTFDAYYTAVDVLSYAGVAGHQLGSAGSPRGTTLFGSIPANRTCEKAGVPDHYCVCEEEVSLKTDDPRAEKAAVAVLEMLNALVKTSGNGSLCAELRLKTIRRVEQVKVSDKILINLHDYFGKMVKEDSAKSILSKFRLALETSPGGGVFEATVVHRTDEGNYVADPDISRINKYGNQSWCLQDPVLKKYCFCKTQEPRFRKRPKPAYNDELPLS